MHRPDRYQLAQLHVVPRLGVPETHCHGARVVREHELDVALGGRGTLARLGHVVHVHDAAHESEVARPGFERADGAFFVFEGGRPVCCGCGYDQFFGREAVAWAGFGWRGSGLGR
jgi:hypothetical protein